jgi:transposase
MTTMPLRVTGGVDTHLDVHVAAALDQRGALLGVESFATTPAGYRDLLGWLRRFGALELVGVEGTGSYGAGLTRLLHTEGVCVVEVDRPNRQRRRRRGKSDPEDAVSAARAAQSGDAPGRSQDPGRKRRGHAGAAGRAVLGSQGPHAGAQPDAQHRRHRT